jgi:hypothetical protein
MVNLYIYLSFSYLTQYLCIYASTSCGKLACIKETEIKDRSIDRSIDGENNKEFDRKIDNIGDKTCKILNLLRYLSNYPTI